MKKTYRIKAMKKIIVVLFLAILVSCVSATQVETIQVPPLIKKMFVFNLDEGEKVTGSLSISGGSGNDINFWITNPQGATVINLDRVSNGANFEFTAHQSGAYTFHFDNQFSLFSSKTVSLTFDVSRALPIDPIMLIAIGVAIIAVVIVISVAMRYRRKTQTTTKTNQPS